MSIRTVRLNDHFVARARTLSRAAGVIVALVGGLALAGWLFDVAILREWHADIAIKGNTAAALLLAGASLWLLAGSRDRPWRRRAGQVLALAVGAIGIATLSQHLFGWDLGIDQLLFLDEPGARATTSPGRMGPPASTCLTLAAVALLLLHARRFAALAQVLSIGIGLIALLAVTGYAYGAQKLYGVAGYTDIALNTALALLGLSAGLLSSSVDRGIASTMAGDGAGSLMARRLLPFAIAVPLLLGWVRSSLEGAGYFDGRFGIAALMLTTIVIFAALIARTAIIVNRMEQQKIAAETSVRERLYEIETIMDVLPIGVFIATDRLVTDITVNRAAREFLRLPRRGDDDRPLRVSLDEVTARHRALRGGVEVPREDLPICRAARDGVTVQDEELELVFDDGIVSHELISAAPLLDEQGNPRGAIACMMDVTARKAAEAERASLLVCEKEARAAAEAANRAKDEFLATVSHELRTPLSAILGWTRILTHGKPISDSVTQRALAAIDRNCRAQAQLIEDLLDVSRITSGNLRLEVKPLDLAEIVKAAAEAVRPAAEARSIRLSMALGSAASRVSGDPERLQQVVWNILTNAVKFSDEGGAVDIRLAAGASEVTVVVADAGEGIDSEFLPYVFDQFRQARDDRTRRNGGLGLGLSIARKLVELHGGTVEAASQGLGHGSSFTVRLPLLGVDTGAGPADVPLREVQ